MLSVLPLNANLGYTVQRPNVARVGGVRMQVPREGRLKGSTTSASIQELLNHTCVISIIRRSAACICTKYILCTTCFVYLTRLDPSCSTIVTPLV
jgi:hypothetical protein